jgi:hypothetical protein
VFTKKISPFPAPREEWKEETKEETKRRQRGARGSLSLGQDIVFENKMPFICSFLLTFLRSINILLKALSTLNI